MEPVLLIPIPFIVILAVVGMRDGVVKRIVEILGVIATVIFTARFAVAVQPWVMDKTGAEEEPALLITWAVLFFAGLILSRLLAVLISKLIRLTLLGWLDRLGGAVLGAAIGVLLASAVILVLGQIPGGQDLDAVYRADPWGRFVRDAAPNVYQGARRLWGQKDDTAWSSVLDRARTTADDVADKTRKKIDESKQRLEDAADKLPDS